MQVIAVYIMVVIIWSTTPLGIVWSSVSVPPMLALLSRMLIALVLGFGILKVLRMSLPVHRTALKLYSYSGIGICSGMVFSYLAARDLPSGLLSLIFGLSPLISGITSPLILKTAPLSGVRKLSLLVAIGGLAIVSADSVILTDGGYLGFFYAIMGVILFSLSGVLVKSVDINIHPLATTVGTLTVCMPVFIAVFIVFDGGQLKIDQWQASSVYAIIYMGIMGSLIGLVGYYYILQKLSASAVAMVTLITPVIALSLGHVLNHEAITLQLVVGACTVLLGLALYNWGQHLLNRLASSNT